MSRKGIALWLAMIMLCSFIVIIVEISPNASAYTPHEFIKIDGDEDFAEQAASESWPGDGTKANPYVIEGYEIDASLNDGIGIYSTTVHFIIRNTFIKDGVEGNSGIYLNRVTNGMIDNCILENNSDGGISLLWSSSITITNNTMIGNGIVIWGYVSWSTHVEYWTTHHIDTSNIVNGRPVYFWKNQTQGTIPTGAGQVILANCSNIIVENQELNQASVGIQIGHSSNITINDNIASNMTTGISIQESRGNMILGNIVSNNTYGIYLDAASNWNYIFFNSGSYNRYGLYLYSDMSRIEYNFFSYNQESGIHLQDGTDNVLSDNTVSNSTKGISLSFSELNTIDNNNLSLNGNGIFLERSQDNLITYNLIRDNLGFGITLSASDNNLIGGCTVVNNSIGISLTNSENNLIYYNHFFDNNDQVYDNNYNRWNNSEGEGNYWSNYNGKDDGSNGRIAGDGIGDTDLPHNGVDMYPIIKSSKKPVQEQKIPWWVSFFWGITAILLLIGYIVNYARNKK